MAGDIVDFLSSEPVITVLVAPIPLFVGPTAGVYLGGVKRARLDDRRQLLRTWLPWLRECFHLSPPLAGPQRQYSFAHGPPQLAFETMAGIENVNRIVRLLPLADRFMWNRVVGPLFTHLAAVDLLWALRKHDALLFKSD